jgi:hypothetical protein
MQTYNHDRSVKAMERARLSEDLENPKADPTDSEFEDDEEDEDVTELCPSCEEPVSESGDCINPDCSEYKDPDEADEDEDEEEGE